MPTLELPSLTAEKRRMVEQIRGGLRQVANVQAVVLGGSHASALARPDSDLDIGLYYRESCPFSIDNIRAFAEGVARPGTRPSIIYFGETEACVPLYDPQGQIARLKEAVRRYPEPLKARIVQGTLLIDRR